jgi:hypothetical protein
VLRGADRAKVSLGKGSAGPVNGLDNQERRLATEVPAARLGIAPLARGSSAERSRKHRPGFGGESHFEGVDRVPL